MTRLNVPEDEPITAGMVTRAIEGAQKKVESHNFDIRKHLLDYDDVMNQQRNSIYGMRRRVLEGGEPLDTTVKDMMSDLTSDLLDKYAAENVKPQDWDLDSYNKALLQQFGVEVEFKQPIEIGEIIERTKNLVMEKYEMQKNALGSFFEQAQTMILLQAIDTKWKEHLQRIDHLREGIGLRGYAQKDPLIEYKKEAFITFSEMNQLVKEDATEKLFRIQIRHEYAASAGENSDEDNELLEDLRPQEPQQISLGHGPVMSPGGSPLKAASVTRVDTGPKVGRNDPCPCGSGKKYKKCHGMNS